MRLLRVPIVSAAAVIFFFIAIPLLVFGEVHWHWRHWRRGRPT